MGLAPKKKKTAKRTGASFKDTAKKSDKLSAYKDSSLPGTLMKSSAQNPSRADTELSRLMTKDVFRSDKNAISKGNSNPRRLK